MFFFGTAGFGALNVNIGTVIFGTFEISVQSTSVHKMSISVQASSVQNEVDFRSILYAVLVPHLKKLIFQVNFTNSKHFLLVFFAY